MVRDRSFVERIFNMVNYFIMVVIMIVTIYPMWFTIVNSLNDGKDLYRGYVFLCPRVFTTISYQTVLADPGMLQSFWITASRTVIVSVLSIFNTAMFAYAFSRPYLKRKNFYKTVGFISMYFSGGLIPSFMLINWLRLYDSYWVYVLPSLFGGFYNVIIFNANYKSIPDSLFESAKLDGANEFKIFLSIVIPLSVPVLAALTVFTAVGVWNDYGTTLFYTQSRNLQTLQYFLLKLIKSNAAADQLTSMALTTNPAVAELYSMSEGKGKVTAKTIELAAMMIASIPMIVLYPFAQKFFVKGVLLGSVKE
jgi:putative aldouronate transport system permease protein